MNDIDDNKFDWGESVKVKDTAPAQFRPGQIASVCGMIKVKTKTLADKYKRSIGEWIYTVEYIGGSDTEIPECFLKKLRNEIISLEKYTSFFHDGAINEINHTGDEITISMESAEMDEEDIKDDIDLSSDDRIRGKLHIEGTKSIKENNQYYTDILRMKYEDAEIFHFEINQNKVELQIKWCSYPPKPYIEEFSTIEIEAEKIWWENNS